MTGVDVLVVGGGPAGAAAAIMLRRAGRAVALLTRDDRPGAQLVGESLPPAASAALAALGVLADLRADPDHRRALGTASAWGTATLSYRDYLLEGTGNGWHLNRASFDRTLLDAAVRAGAVLLRGRLGTARPAPGGWTVACGPGTVGARVVIDATGRRAAFATALGARRQRVDRLTAAAAVLPGTGAIPGHTLIEAAPHGWWYAAPQPGGRVLVAFLSDSDILRAHGYADPARWARALAATGHVAAVAAPAGAPAGLTVRPAGSHLLRPCLGPDWIAVGDAALATDPLASAGIVSAIRSGAAAARMVLDGHLADPARRRDHAAGLGHRFLSYLRQHRQYYALERRWDSAFWHRRHAG